MEKVNGGELAHRIDIGTYNNVTIPNYDFIKVFYNIVCAVKCMHDNDYGHFDLKPQNIMMVHKHDSTLKDKDTEIRLIDFGFSDTKLNKRRGTYKYMAPEIWNLQENNSVDKRSDIWALGIIFFKLLFRQNLIIHIDNNENNKEQTKNKIKEIVNYINEYGLEEYFTTIYNSLYTVYNNLDTAYKEILKNTIVKLEKRWDIDQLKEYLENIFKDILNIKVLNDGANLSSNTEVDGFIRKTRKRKYHRRKSSRKTTVSSKRDSKKKTKRRTKRRTKSRTKSRTNSRTKSRTKRKMK